jgi:hypothetical protein
MPLWLMITEPLWLMITERDVPVTGVAGDQVRDQSGLRLRDPCCPPDEASSYEHVNVRLR